MSRTGLIASMRLRRNADMVASATRVVTATGQTTEMSIGISMSFAGRTVSSVSSVRGPDGTRTAVDLQRSLSSGPGVGYQFHSEGGGPEQLASGALQYQGSYGRYEVRRDMVGDTQHSSVNLSGAIVGVGGRLFASRAVRNSFALVRVPGVNDVRTYSSNQEIGKTDSHGNLLIPDLLAYYGNQLRIADGDVPFDYVVSNTQMMLAPPYRGGAVVQFPVQRITQTTGKIVVAGAEANRVPTYGELSVTVDGTAMASPIGRDGEFYFENLQPGRYPAVVSDAGGRCEFILDVPESKSAQVVLGTITCK
jgi:outer membrane usher protein